MAIIAIIITLGAAAFNQVALRNKVTEKFVAQRMRDVEAQRSNEIERIKQQLDDCITDRIMLNARIDKRKVKEEELLSQIERYQQICDKLEKQLKKYELKKYEQDCCG